LHRVTINADGQAQHIAAHYRPLSSLMFFSRLLRESLAGTPYAGRFSPARLDRPAGAARASRSSNSGGYFLGRA